MYNPDLTRDYSKATAEQIIQKKKELAEQERILNEVLKEKLNEQRATFVQNVYDQVVLLEIDPVEFVKEFYQKGGIDNAIISPTDMFMYLSDDEKKLEQWFSDFTKIKNNSNRSKKNPLFKIPKKTVAGISNTKFSIIYIEDIKGGEKAIKAIADKIGETKDIAISRLVEGADSSDPEIAKILTLLYPVETKVQEMLDKVTKKK